MVAAHEAHADPQKWISLALALVMHLALAAALVFGVSWRSRPPEVVEVNLVRAAPAPAPVEPARPVPARREAPPPPPVKAEPVPIPKPDIAIKDRDKPKPPPKAQPVEPPPEAPNRRERDQRLLQEHQSETLMREMQQLENRRYQQQLERELARSQADQLAAARAEAAARADAAARANEAQAAQARMQATYHGRIRDKILGNLVPPLDLRGNPVATFKVTQLPSGEILDVVLTRSSGNRAWDDAAERAIRKSSPLPKPENPTLFQRELPPLKICPDKDNGCQ